MNRIETVQPSQCPANGGRMFPFLSLGIWSMTFCRSVRRKRGISTSDMAARLFVSRDTLWRMERGDPTVALGTLATAVFVLGFHDRLGNLAAPASDELALNLDERRLPQRIRRPRS